MYGDIYNKGMYSCFYKSKKFLGCLMYREAKKQKTVGMYFLKLLLKIFFIKKLFMANLLSNGLQEKVMTCCIIICYITKRRLDVQFVKKIPLEMVIGQQMKEKGYDKN